MTRDLKYYQGRRKKYEAAIPKLTKMINQSTININSWLTNIIVYKIPVNRDTFERESRKRDALLKQYGRIQGIIQMLDAYKSTNLPANYRITWTFNQ